MINPEKEQKAAAEAVKGMITTPGWQFIESELMLDAKVLHTKYLDSIDGSPEERMAKYDERAIRKLFAKIAHYVSIK